MAVAAAQAGGGASDWLITISTFLQHGGAVYETLYALGIAFFCFFVCGLRAFLVALACAEACAITLDAGLPLGFVDIPKSSSPTRRTPSWSP